MRKLIFEYTLYSAYVKEASIISRSAVKWLTMAESSASTLAFVGEKQALPSVEAETE